MKKIIQLLCLLLVATTFLTACGGASSSDAYVTETTAAVFYSANSTSAGAMSYPEEAVETALDSGSILTGNTEFSVPQNTGRKLIRTVSLQVETYDFDNLLTKLQEQITALSGYIEQSDVSGKSIQNDYSRRRAYMTVRVPSTALDQFVASVESNGNVTNKTETTNDVTLNYTDLESKKKSLTIEQDRIFELLEKADTLESIIALEERLSEIRYELESMESRLRLYDNQVEYSTIHINIEEVKIYTPTAPETIGERIQRGFTSNLENMKDFCVDLFISIISISPFWIPAALIVLILCFLLRRKSARKKIDHLASSIPVSFEENDFEHTSMSGHSTENKE